MADHLTARDIARVFDVPPWLIDPAVGRPKLASLRWRLRRIWPLR